MAEETKVFTVRVSMKYLPDHWRDIEVWSESDLMTFGYAALAAFDADGFHVWDIETNGVRYIRTNPMANDMMWMNGFGGMFNPRSRLPEQDIEDIPLRYLCRRKGSAGLLTYDYGDRWEFTLKVTDWRYPDPKETMSLFPRCTAGAKCGIIEDCGGPWALEERIDQWETKTLPDDFCDWMGFPYDEKTETYTYEWDPDAFDLKEVNRSMRALRPKTSGRGRPRNTAGTRLL